MKIKTFPKLLLETIGFAFAGHLQALAVTFAMGAFGNNNIALGIAAFCSVLLYMMMVFSAGYKDGEIEKKLVVRKTIENPNPDKWIKIGLIVMLIMWIPCLLLFVGSFVYLTFFRFALASTMALSTLFGMKELPVWAPFIFMGIYALTPVMCRFGHWAGYNEKMTLDNLIYKRRK